MVKSTRQTLDKIVAQAKESARVLETLQKEGVARALSFMQNVQNQLPSKDEAQQAASQKIMAGLRKIGLASHAEVRDLEQKVEDLALELRAQISKVARKNAQKTSKTDTEIHA